jgi:hypothetical protein
VDCAEPVEEIIARVRGNLLTAPHTMLQMAHDRRGRRLIQFAKAERPQCIGSGMGDGVSFHRWRLLRKT